MYTYILLFASSLSDHDECEEETCVGGACVNTVGSYYCSCPPPLVLDDTQRNCVNSSHLTVGKASILLLHLCLPLTSVRLCSQSSSCVLQMRTCPCAGSMCQLT